MAVAETEPEVRRMPAGPLKGVGPPVRPRPIFSILRMLAGLLALLTLAAGPSHAAEVELKTEETYGRMIITFPDLSLLPAYKATATNGVLVLHFDSETEIPVERVGTVLGRYVTIARADPQGLGARFALARGVQVNSMEAGNQLFIDFLPQGWSGPPPRLPDEIVQQLAKKAADATRAAQEAELLRAAGSKTARLDIKVSRGPTFSRFTFRWNIPFEAEFQRQDGAVAVSFNRRAEVDISEIRAFPPPFVQDIEAASTEGRTTVLISVQPVADVRAFRDEDTYVVDVQGPINDAALPPVASALQRAIDPNSATGHGGTERVSAPGLPQVASDPAAVDHGTTADHAAPADHATPAASVPPADHGAAAAHETPAEHPAPTGQSAPAGHAPVIAQDAPAPHDAAAAHDAPDAHGTPAGHDPAPAAATFAPPPRDGDEVLSSAESPDGAKDRMLADEVIRVEAKRIGRATRVVFPYKRTIGSALFARGPSLWLVFDDASPIEAEPLQEALAGFARSVKLMKVGEAQAVRIEMAEPLLATLNPDNTYWVVTIGDMVIEPTRPLPIRRTISEAGESSLDVPFGPVSAVHSIDDPDIGDRIMVVTGSGQPRGLIKPQAFAEVEALSSAHGLAFVPRVDDLTLSVNGDLVTLRRPGGLSLSSGGSAQRAAVLDLTDAIGGTAGARAGYVDFSDLEAASPGEITPRRQALSMNVTQAQNKAEQVDRWYQLAKFNLANGLGAEALAVLALIKSLSPEEIASERMTILSAGGELLMGRPKDALTLLDKTEFQDSPDSAFWTAMALSEIGDYGRSHKLVPRAESVLGTFPGLLQKRFLLDGVRSAIELNDYGKARSLLAQIDPKLLTKGEVLQLDLLNARATDATGQTTEAIDLLSKVVRSGTGRIAAEATYRLIQMQRREGQITLDQAVDRLEQLSVSWRGDEIELDTLRTLGQLSIEKADYRRAFEVMRTAETVAPQADTTRMMNEEMQAAFASLFLDGKADGMKPIDALALYYDYRELTPQGRRGDAMVRKLADRLVNVDLLDQAAALLAYQVDNRLRGAARAQVAADLAVVHLLAKRPDKALLALARSRQSELPITIERQRRIVEARALASTGKPDLALDLLTPLSGAEIERQRAEILWDANRYQDAGDQFERVLGNRWNDELPLSASEQVEVLKAGIGFTLARDQLSTDRLRSKFSAKMSKTANAAAFEAVTSPVSTAGSSFQDVVRSIAGIDSMQNFLGEYRRRYLELGTGVKAPLDGDVSAVDGLPAEGPVAGAADAPGIAPS